MKISILIATKNRETYLLQALRSVAEQTRGLDGVEVIVVHDGLPSCVPDIPFLIHPFSRPDFREPTVRFLAQPHQGRSAAINHAFRESTGDYITVLDDDDFMAPTKLARLEESLDLDGDVVWGLPQFVDIEATPIETPTAGEVFMCRQPIITWDGFLDGGEQWYVHGTACMYRRRLWQAAGPWDEKLEGCEEYEYNLRLLHLGAVFKGVQSITDLYRIHPGQKSGRKARRTARRLESRQRVRAKIAAWKQGEEYHD